nr:hypothetical protein [Streptobacillus moniliformis]
MNTNGKNSIAYGDGSKATAPNSIVLGIKSYILGDKNQGDSIIIGNNAYIYILYMDQLIIKMVIMRNQY